MNWRKENQDYGAMWVGLDTIYNQAHLPNKTGKGFRNGFWGLAALMVVLGLFLGFAPPMLILAAIFAGIGQICLAETLPEFIGNDWVLKGGPESLNYSTAPRGASADFVKQWTLPLSEVASVEASRTQEWEKVRSYEYLGGRSLTGVYSPGIKEIPDAEYQTYIMTTDGRRLVVNTANAGREETAALAVSVKAWIEGARASAAPVAPADAPSPSTPEKGFSL